MVKRDILSYIDNGLRHNNPVNCKVGAGKTEENIEAGAVARLIVLGNTQSPTA